MTITIIPAAPPPHIASFAICLLAESKNFFRLKLSMMPSMSLKLSRELAASYKSSKTYQLSSTIGSGNKKLKLPDLELSLHKHEVEKRNRRTISPYSMDTHTGS
jgi:hypothetical protein